jgi:hypothetical protein
MNTKRIILEYGMFGTNLIVRDELKRMAWYIRQATRTLEVQNGIAPNEVTKRKQPNLQGAE